MKKERKHITHNRILFAVKFLYLTLVIISLIIVFLYIAFKVFVSPPPIDNIDKKTTVSQENEAPETSISKKERKDRSYTFLLVASDKSGALADVIMLVNYDVLNQNVGMVSIPRDTLVDPNHIASFPKINSSYSHFHSPSYILLFPFLFEYVYTVHSVSLNNADYTKAVVNFPKTH